MNGPPLSGGRRLGRYIAGGVILLVLILFGDRLSFRAARTHQLRFAHTFTTESERKIIEPLIAEFEQAHPGVAIEQIISNSETYNTLGWRLQFRGKHPPDISFQWQGYKVQMAIDHGWALELTPFLSPAFRDQFVQAALAGDRDRGGLYFLPHSVDLSNLVWFNRSAFEKSGVRPPGSVTDWIDTCQKLRQAQLLPLAQGNRDLWPIGNIVAEWCAEDLGPAVFASLFQAGAEPPSPRLAGLDLLLDLKRKGAFDFPGILTPDAVSRFSDIDAKVVFLTQRSVQHIVGSWFLADIEDARRNNELKFPPGFFLLPPPPNKPKLTTGVTTGFIVHRQTRYPKEAAAFLELLLSRKYQAEFAKVGSLSARRDAAEFTEDPLGRELLQALAGQPSLLPPPDTAYAPEQAALFYLLCGKVLSGDLTLANAPAFWLSEKRRLARKMF